MRDRYLLLERRFRKKVSEDEKASGTSPEPSEEDVMMEEIVSLFDEADRLNDSKKKKIQEEASQAEEMRNMSLETFKQSQERSQDGQPKQKKKKRASGADTMTFLKERVEIESRQRLEELEIRKRELQVEKEAKEACYGGRMEILSFWNLLECKVTQCVCQNFLLSRYGAVWNILLNDVIIK